MTDESSMSAASRRAAAYPNRGAEWSTGFAFSQVTGIGFEEGVHRRDPSSILKVGGLYYVWYTRSEGPSTFRRPGTDPADKLFPWDHAEIWYATSSDGMHWTEQGVAAGRGGKGAYDERTLCTPDAMTHEGTFYLVYQAAQDVPYSGREETVGMAVADSPDGPWQKTPEPILSPMDDGAWFGENGTYNDGRFRGLTHDPMLWFFQERFHLYYKCGSTYVRGEPHKYAGRDTRWGVALSDTPTGPYQHSPFNPVTNSGHETLLWPYRGGLVGLLNRDGPEKDTIQYTTDGVNFEPMGVAWNTPWAGGSYRCPDPDDHPLKGIEWGLGHIDEGGSEWNHIVRFDADPGNTSVRPSYYPRSW